MAGPAAGIILPKPLNDSAKAGIRREILAMSTLVSEDDFWIQDRPFLLVLGEDYEAEPDEDEAADLERIIGWKPQDEVNFVAMGDGRQDHLYLGQVCLHFVKKLGGLVDLGGALKPPVPAVVPSWAFGTHDHWSEYEPYFQKMVKGLPGRVYTVPYLKANGDEWVYHVADAEFLKAWLDHPNFHMVK